MEDDLICIPMLGARGFRSICDHCHSKDTEYCAYTGITSNDPGNKLHKTGDQPFTMPIGVMKVYGDLHKMNIHACREHAYTTSARVYSFLNNYPMVRTMDLDQHILSEWITMVKDKLWIYRTDRTTEPEGIILKKHDLREPVTEWRETIESDPIPNFQRDGKTDPEWQAHAFFGDDNTSVTFRIKSWYLDDEVKKKMQLTDVEEQKLTNVTNLLSDNLDMTLKEYGAIYNEFHNKIIKIAEYEAYRQLDKSCSRCGKLRLIRS